MLEDVLNQKEVILLTKIPRSTLYYFIENEGFPAPKKLGLRMARWSKKEILEWYKLKGFDIQE